MAQLLVYANADNDLDDGLHYIQGDIITIQSDTHIWGRQEHPSTSTNKKFWIVVSPDIQFSEEQINTLTSPLIEYAEGEVIYIKRRKWGIQINLLNQLEITELDENGILTIEANRLFELIIDKITNQTLTI
jgi:hypothetical protein